MGLLATQERDQAGTCRRGRLGRRVRELQGLGPVSEVGGLQRHTAQGPAVGDVVLRVTGEAEGLDEVLLPEAVGPLVHGHPAGEVDEIGGRGEHLLPHLHRRVRGNPRHHRVGKEGRGHRPGVAAAELVEDVRDVVGHPLDRLDLARTDPDGAPGSHVLAGRLQPVAEVGVHRDHEGRRVETGAQHAPS
ncbi:hypothetical protein ACGFNX_36905 [Streptomyces sp. NPDC048723]|uniref:hypothetical protein n=1 Tax=Streptomyces sp. NPDC048723 TaxID=3365589 RepID=UPI00371D6E99